MSTPSPSLPPRSWRSRFRSLMDRFTRRCTPSHRVARPSKTARRSCCGPHVYRVSVPGGF